MNPPLPRARPPGFTFVELLLALALGALVAVVLGALVHGLLVAGTGQNARLRGPHAARAALRRLARDVGCAFAPPVQDLPPLELATSTEPGRPEVRLSFFAPAPVEPAIPHGYDIEQLTYEVIRTEDDVRELRRSAVPCSGPRTNAPATQVLYAGPFTLAIEAVTPEASRTDWPPPEDEEPALPPALRLTLVPDGAKPLRIEVVVQAAGEIRSPVERQTAPPDPPPAAPAAAEVEPPAE